MSTQVNYFAFLGSPLDVEYEQNSELNVNLLKFIEREYDFNFYKYFFYDNHYQKDQELYGFFRSIEENSSVVIYHPFMIKDCFFNVLQLLTLKNIKLHFITYSLHGKTVKNKKVSAKNFLRECINQKVDFTPYHSLGGM